MIRANQSSLQQPSSFSNNVDTWIDELDDNRSCDGLSMHMGGVGANVLMASLVQQYLPKMEVPKFSGEALKWVEFIVTFRDVVHNQPYLSDKQRNQLLIQHLESDAKRSVKEYVNDPKGYVASLKKLKYMFGQRPTVARAILAKVTKGKKVENNDFKGLSELYYSINDCLITLKQLNYASDLYSSETLAQTVKRLPQYLVMKWAERCIRIRGYAEPSLCDLGEWLKHRLLASKEAFSSGNNQKKVETKGTSLICALTNNNQKQKCQMCEESHQFWKCKKYKDLKPPVKKMEVIKKMNLCFNCFSKGHSYNGCKSENTCFQKDCNEKHHTSLHDYFMEKEKSIKAAKDKKKARKEKQSGAKVEEQSQDVVTEEEVLTINAVRSRPSSRVYLQIVPIKITISEKVADTYALLDNCSQSTLIREDFFKKFRVKGEKSIMNQGTIKDKSEDVEGIKVTLTVSKRDGTNSIEIEDVFVQPADRFNMPSRPRLIDVSDDDIYTHLDGLDLDEVSPDDISILIGANAPECHIVTDVRRGKKGQPLVVKTPFEWALFGPSRGDCGLNAQCMATYSSEAVNASLPSLWTEEERSPKVFINLVKTRTDADLHEAVERLWKQEQSGILPQKEIAMSREDRAALQRMEKETVMVDGKYQIPMLWRDLKEQLPNNITMAKKRFGFLMKKLRADSELFKKYKAVIDGYLQQDPPHARKLKPEGANKTSTKTWTLPTFPVFNPNKPDKIRVVNDAAAEFHGISLNKSLLTGPDLLNLLVGVLMRLRNGKVAIAADIEAMFHQVRTTLEDSDSLRFLWKDDPTSDEPPDTYEMLVHVFGAKDSPTIANYAVKRTARDNHTKFSSLTYETALRSFYVDDMLKSVSSVEDAITLAKELIDMMKCGGFRLCKFLSNYKEVMDALPASELSPDAILRIEDEGSLERTLGILWNTTTDSFTYTFEPLELPASKRGILTNTAKLFDPLGFLTPFLLGAKLIIQTLWRLGCEWDEIANEEIRKQWERWLEGAKKVCKIKLKRQYVEIGERCIVGVQLHIFCDASEDAFGCCGYVRYSFKSEEHECALVMAKSRLAPLKTLTLPRLELNAARCGARMAHLVVHEIDLPIEKVHYWSDSTLTLQYINNERHRMKVFVANRASEILESSDAKDWSHVPGDINPADLLTRGIADPEKLMKSRWFKGPVFLEENEERWPKFEVEHLDENNTEIKHKPLFVGLSLVDVEEVDLVRISSWLRLIRVAAWMIRFSDNCLSKREERNFDETLSLDELNTAEDLVLRYIQSCAFKDEIQNLSDGKTLPATNPLAKLSPFVDSKELLRVGGRLKRISIPVAMKHPIILPRQHKATKLLVERIHRRSAHVGPEHTFSIVREKYWIMSGRVLVNQVVHQCFFCRVRRAKQQFPYMANLPICRAAIDQPPFCHCGVDLFGPISIKQQRKRLKRWIVLFTCLTIRCVHLEVVEACDTDAFINSVRRFTNRRGSPSHIYSDNGTNFKGAANELQEFVQKLDKTRITDFATSNKINWHFNPPAAPHMGGAWERLVRSTKEVMYGLVKDHVLTDPQLLTFITEAENILNSRPLTHLSDDVSDLEALTPNHVLLGQHRNWVSITDISEVDITSRRKWKQVQALRAMFWSRWVQEYLPQLNQRPCWKDKTCPFKVGELVLVKNDDIKRSKWPLGRVLEVKPGGDGVVRVVKVRMSGGSYVRPVAKLFKLEDSENDIRHGEENVADVNSTTV